MPDVVLENVTKVFPGDVVAVNELRLHVRHGELLVLVGPSGCGKTTTLRLIAGLEDPTAGTVRIGDRDVTGLPPAQRDVGFVFQRPALYPHRTVRDNLAFSLVLREGASWWRRLFSERRRQQHQALLERVTATARMLGLETVLDRLPSQLSGGQQQRRPLGAVGGSAGDARHPARGRRGGGGGRRPGVADAGEARRIARPQPAGDAGAPELRNHRLAARGLPSVDGFGYNGSGENCH